MFLGGALLISERPPTEHANGAVVLQGSIEGQKVRIAGAIGLLQQGIVDSVLLSVPKESYWGQSIPPVARRYLERTYGADVAAHIDFCETGATVNSTAEEMKALAPCIRDHRWQSMVVVTSDYHTRRAGLIWRRFAAHEPGMRLWIVGVQDPEFQRPWWRHRQSAKIFINEFTKLVWTSFGG